MKYILIILLAFSCQKELTQQLKGISLNNPGFEDGFSGWTRETKYTGPNGWKIDSSAVASGKVSLKFFARQPYHIAFETLQETPWNGIIYQTVTGLTNGTYTFKCQGLAGGTGMYVFANDKTVELARPDWFTIYTVTFEVTDGTAKVGFKCTDAGGTTQWAPYYFVDDCGLIKKL